MSLNGASPVSAFSVYKKQLKGNKKAKPEDEPPGPNLSSNNEDDEHPPVLVPIQVSNSVEGNNLKQKNKKVTKNGIKNNTNNINETSVSEIVSELNKTDPSPDGLRLFKWLIAPLTPKTFFERYWERETLFVGRNRASYYGNILTTEKLDGIFREFPLYYTRNVDVVSYENGIKEVHNEEGRVVASALYDFYSNGCSIRVLNPQTYDQKVHLLIATLQEYFGAMVGTNVYLTPPGSQGFAPHYDDIEAFILQLEGRKHWKLYKPSGSDVLARNSSPNLKHENIGKPFLEVTLNAGDLLYFPRGTIHEGRTDPDAHSLHITVSVYQHNSYADLLGHILPDALKKAANEDLEFRKGLPFNYLKHIGWVNRDSSSKERSFIINKVEALMQTLTEYVDVDQAADKLGKKFMYDSMPPVLSKREAIHTAKYDGDFMRDGKVLNRVEIGMDTEVRLLRYHCIRLVIEDDTPKIYYNTDNAKVYHGEEEQVLAIDHQLIPGVEILQKSYPEFIEVEDLPIDDNIAKAQLVSDLWERGLLVTNGPLPSFSDGDESTDEVCDEISD
ncbi:hypothetical protein NQ317_003531 [Molorchus minor]|uniref:Bifunctional lysine-specific demethylase and histidyl-hydroxylase n=1 Tax=Molorchus minor TaxID=1323400 RepID=A0ABQ9K448_9CUCU|nr:hypothetical protein NQ317_003531 [Molorchus minor]